MADDGYVTKINHFYNGQDRPVNFHVSNHQATRTVTARSTTSTATAMPSRTTQRRVLRRASPVPGGPPKPFVLGDLYANGAGPAQLLHHGHPANHRQYHRLAVQPHGIRAVVGLKALLVLAALEPRESDAKARTMARLMLSC